MNTERASVRTVGICLGLVAAVLAVYWPMRHAAFVSIDDLSYISRNPHVNGGLTWANFKWALTSEVLGNWHPLTILSYLLDVQIFGLNPGAFHLENIVLHALNSVLLFLWLQWLTKAVWPSATVAALFALHPMHVESVAWIAERKDVLSALFWLLSIWSYCVYARGVNQPRSRLFYWLALAFFGLGLMAKPMVVTLPFVLLLLDFWPLRRTEKSWSKLGLEKAPFFLLVLVSCIVTYFAQSHGRAVVAWEDFPFASRAVNLPVNYIRYLDQMFWPMPLAVLYPMIKWSIWAGLGATVLLVIFSALAWLGRQSQPWLLFGWLWFLGTLVPVIGIVQVGLQPMADRYTYIPSIGLFVGLVWWARSWRNAAARWILPALAAATIGACLILTALQVPYWRNSETLLSHAVNSVKNNFRALAMLGSLEVEDGNTETGLRHLHESIRLQPEFGSTHDMLGKALLDAGHIDEAMNELQLAIKLDPNLPGAHYNLGHALLAKGRVADALDQFQAQVDLEPDNFAAQLNMGTVLLQNGLAGDAIPHLRAGVALAPTNAEASCLLGTALYRTGQTAEAIRHYEEANSLKPNLTDAQNDLAWILACNPDANLRNGRQAVELALSADQLSGGRNPAIIGTLAASYAEAGQFADAISANQSALRLAQSQTNLAMVETLTRRLHAYENHRPWRDHPTGK